MANVITIPKLNARAPEVRVPEIDTEFDPYARIARGLGGLGDAISDYNLYHPDQPTDTGAPPERGHPNAPDASGGRRKADPTRERDDMDDQVGIISATAEMAKGVAETFRDDIGRRAIVPGYVDDIAKRTSEALEDLIDPSEEGRRRRLIRRGAAELLLHFLHQAMLLESEARAKARTEDKVKEFGALADDARAHPGDQNYLADARAMLDALPEGDRKRLEPQVRRVARAWIWGLIKQNPKLALEMLRSRSKEGAQEDLGLSDLERALFTTLAEKALEDETRKREAQHQFESIQTQVWTHETLSKVGAGHLPAGRAYEPALDYPQHARAFEALGDKTREDVERKMEDAVTAGKTIVARKPLHADAEEGVERHFEALEEAVRQGQGRPPKDWISLAVKVMGRIPKKVQGDVLAGLQSKEPARWAESARTLHELFHVDVDGHAVADWAPPEALHTAVTSAALDSAGVVNDVAKFNLLTKRPTPDIAKTRRDYFDSHLDRGAWSIAIANALGVKMDDLVYRPDEDGEERTETLPDDGTSMRAQLLSMDASPGMIWGGNNADARTADRFGREKGFYRRQTLEKINAYRKPILAAAKTLGVSETAVAGVIAEELDDSDQQPEWFQDIVSWGKRRRLDLLTHKDIEAAYDEWERVLADDPTAGDPGGPIKLLNTKFRYPATFDIGMGKIRLHTAIRMLREYNQRYPDSDPLNLKKYNRAYDQLARDLDSASASTTAAFAALMVEEATIWFKGKAPKLWERLSQEDRDALIVEYYNQGRERIHRKYTEQMKKTGSYKPEPGESGKRHRKNAGSIVLYLLQLTEV